MSPTATVVATVALGAVGALLRAEVTAWTVRRNASARAGTWLVNLAGALGLGVVVGLADSGRLAPDVARIVGAGLLGGATTFSTWMVLVLRPDARATRARPWRDRLGHGGGMLLAGVAAAGAGVWLAGLAG